ncbi:hypothetical protein AYO20_04320 [Fonsecaea nubica]|uniref:Uncharacterized protein n=1 Tax=Fonsecaea nubica TaxID=856822 RepID=A0A178D4V1_9EURO|nr:hypothetical protein AYO20_04320 [Fonsecaea nubica]OAL36424.1 hypothetical protein AYO20_04320 [Fonsecaea nubica]
MANQNPLGPQPDFDLIADELRKAQNLPAVTNGDLILAQLQAIHREFAAFRQETAAFRQEAAEFRQETRQEFEAVRRDITGIREDITGIREDIRGIREDITGLRKDVGGINLAIRASYEKQMLRVHIGLTKVAGQPPP